MYEIKIIPIKTMSYLWESPLMKGSNRQNIIRQFDKYEDQLLKGTLNPINRSDREIKKVFDSICELGKIINPFHVKQAFYNDTYTYEDGVYVIVGNQRLCGLRAYNNRFPEKKILEVECIILDVEDSWSNRNRAIVEHPYQKVEGYDS